MNDNQLFDAFLLGVRVTDHAYDINAPGTESEKPWALLREIAEGKSTLVSSDAEKRLKYPDMQRSLRESLPEMTSQLIQKDRELARRIYDAFGARLP